MADRRLRTVTSHERDRSACEYEDTLKKRRQRENDEFEYKKAQDKYDEEQRLRDRQTARTRRRSSHAARGRDHGDSARSIRLIALSRRTRPETADPGLECRVALAHHDARHRAIAAVWAFGWRTTNVEMAVAAEDWRRCCTATPPRL
jgi:hypothetical protein